MPGRGLPEAPKTLQIGQICPTWLGQIGRSGGPSGGLLHVDHRGRPGLEKGVEVPAESITSRSAAERFVKDRLRPEARIGPGVVEALIARLTALADQAVRKADALAKGANRTTVLDRDLAETFQTVSPVGSDQPADPAIVFALLDRMTTEQIGQLVRQIQEWLAQRPR